MNNEREQKWFRGMIIVTALLGLIFIGFRVYHQHVIHAAKVEQQELNHQQRVYMHRVQTVRKRYVTVNQNNKDDPRAQAIAKNNGNSAALSAAAKNFFHTYDSWNNHASYMAMQKKLSQYMTQDVAKNKDIFSDDKDTTGHSLIDALGLSEEPGSVTSRVESVNGNTITGLVYTTYTAGYSGNQLGEGIQVFEVQYDKVQNKFTQINLLMANSNGDSN